MLCEPDEKFLSNKVISSRGRCEWGNKFIDTNFENFLKEFLDEKLSVFIKKILQWKLIY